MQHLSDLVSEYKCLVYKNSENHTITEICEGFATSIPEINFIFRLH